MGIRKTQITIHRVPLDVTKNHLGAFFMTNGKVATVSQFSANQALQLALEVTVRRETFVNIPNMVVSRGRSIYVVVEDRLSRLWLCGAAGYIAKLCPGKNTTPIPKATYI